MTGLPPKIGAVRGNSVKFQECDAELKRQKHVLQARKLGLCQHVENGVPCEEPTIGKFCEKHVASNFKAAPADHKGKITPAKF